ncbi:transposase [Saccharopolyspora sp. NPDC003752]
MKQIAKDFTISEFCLANWLCAAAVDDSTRAGVTRDESTELRKLRERNRVLEQENEVLRKAAAYLAQANLPGEQSSRSSMNWPRPAPQSGCRSR